MNFEDVFNESNFPRPKYLIPVPEFFQGKNIFITGATGFMGKVLVEKLLWSCKDVGNLYLLMRPKKNIHPKERLQALISLPIFERLKERDPKCLTKLKLIIGDVAAEDLDISKEDRKLLESSVSVIFHVASSVRFKDPLKKAILLNVRGTRNIVELGRNMINLKVLIYVSTVYCNCDKNLIEEKIILSDFDWRTAIEIAEKNDEYILDILHPKLLDTKPNTYLFTKFLAENVINDFAAVIPSIIFRPSIVTYCVNEPTPGWVDSLNGPSGLAAGIYSGVLHVLYGDIKCLPNYIPCDYSINGIILATWYRGLTETNECLVVNGASTEKNKFSMHSLMKYATDLATVIPPSRILWYPSFTTTKSKFVYYLLLIFTHILPAIFIDFILYTKGIKFRLMRLYRQLFIANEALSHFICNQWDITTNNFVSMKYFLTDDDKSTFPYIFEPTNERDILRIGAIGLKKYIYKDDTSESALKASKTNYKRMFWLKQVSKGFFIMTAFWILKKIAQSYILSAIIDLNL